MVKYQLGDCKWSPTFKTKKIMFKNKFIVVNEMLQTGILLLICIVLFSIKGRFKSHNSSTEEAIIKHVGSNKINFEPTELLYYDPEQEREDSIRESRTNVSPYEHN